MKRRGWYFVTRNDGRQAQDVWFVAQSLEELLAGGRVLIDPNTLSVEGTDSVSWITVSPDGHYLAYGLSEGGSDWITFKLLTVETGEPADDASIQTKFSAATWLPDSASYLYSDFAHEGHAAGTQTNSLGGAQLKLHRVGTPQDQDQLILEFPDNDRLMFWGEVSDDQQFVILTIVSGTENRNRIWVYRVLETEHGQSALSDPIKIIDEPIAEFTFVRSEGQLLYLSTDLDAPLGRIVSVDLNEFAALAEIRFVEVVGESTSTLLGADAAGEELILSYLHDAQPRMRRFDLDGTGHDEIPVPGGAVVGLSAHAGDPEVFIGMSSITAPTTSYRFDVDSGEVRVLDQLVGGSGSFTPPVVSSERHYATSADGTRVPYFVITPEGVDRSKPQPTLLYGYGGFKIPVLADYRPGWSGWLAAGGIVVIANLRGGGEFGTEWYDAGRLANKQNVFDDFIAVAEDLKKAGVTTTEQLALHGRSNGGLLVGATMTQRPDLAAVALPGVGVLDLLRFHKFTIGAAWVSDYGSPEDPEEFATALAYSPLHNVTDGESYPATLVLTGDHDDRVVPLHSHKFTAALQHAQAGERPVLTRIEVATGHGMGKPTHYVAAEWADLLAFAAHHTGLQPK